MTVAGGAPATLHQLAERYGQAWNDHDLDAILALQTADSGFRIHGVDGVMRWDGIEACRAAYEHLLDAWPDQRFEVTALAIGEELYVCHQLVTSTLALPWTMGGRTYAPTDRAITFELVDIMHCQDMRIRMKDSWVDGLAIHRQLTDAA